MPAPDGFTTTATATAATAGAAVDAMGMMGAVLALSTGLSSATDQCGAGAMIVKSIIETTDARRAVLLIQNYPLISDGRRNADGIDVAQFSETLSARLIPLHLLNDVIRTRRPTAWRAADKRPPTLGGYVVPDGVVEVVCLPMIARSELIGLLYVEIGSFENTSGELAREFLDFVACHCGAVLGLLQSNDQATESALKSAILSGQLDELRALKSRLTRLGRGGSWGWDADAGSMSISPELRSVLGLGGANQVEVKSIWDLEIRFGGQVPPIVQDAIARNAPFETEIEIIRPADEILTTLLLVGEPAGSGEKQYVGLAFDIGPQLQRNFVERDHAILKHRLEELRQRMADPLTSIMLDSNAAERFLRRNHPDYEMIYSALSRIEGRASLISDMIDETPTTLSRPENYQWI